jgi:hypothetical protein
MYDKPKYPPSISVNLLEKKSAKGNRYWEFQLKGVMMIGKNNKPYAMISEVQKRPYPESQGSFKKYEGNFVKEEDETGIPEVTEEENNDIPF